MFSSARWRRDGSVPQDSVRLRLIDQSQAPVAGAIAGTSVTVNDLPGDEAGTYVLLGSKEGSRTSDDAGAIELKRDDLFFENWPQKRPEAVCIIHRSRNIGAFVRVRPCDLGKAAHLTLQPLCQVQGEVTSSELRGLGRELPWTNVYVFWLRYHQVSDDDPYRSRRQRGQSSDPTSRGGTRADRGAVEGLSPRRSGLLGFARGTGPP